MGRGRREVGEAKGRRPINSEHNQPVTHDVAFLAREKDVFIFLLGPSPPLSSSRPLSHTFPSSLHCFFRSPPFLLPLFLSPSPFPFSLGARRSSVIKSINPRDISVTTLHVAYHAALRESFSFVVYVRVIFRVLLVPCLCTIFLFLFVRAADRLIFTYLGTYCVNFTKWHISLAFDFFVY